MQEALDATEGSLIQGVNEFQPRPRCMGDRAFLEARSAIARTVPRRLIAALRSALAEVPAVALLLGPLQVSKAILALEGAHSGLVGCLDLEPSGN